MKKLFLAILFVAGLAALASEAQAGWYGHRSGGYYGYYRRPARYVYSDDCYFGGPRYAYYRRPIRTYYYPAYDYCGPRARVFFARPRFSFFFGF